MTPPANATTPSNPSPHPSLVVSGVGLISSAELGAALGGTFDAPLAPAPVLTSFEVPEAVPAYGFEALDFSFEEDFPNQKTYLDRTSALALGAAKRALADAGLADPAARPAGLDLGCAYGTTFGCLEAMEIFWKKVKQGNPKFAPPLPFTHSYANSPSSLLCIEFSLKGPAATFSGEELAGLEALLYAFDLLASGAAEALLVCASESLTPALHAHLLALDRLSPSGTASPWSPDCDGMVPGEGAACLVLERAQSAARRGHLPLAQLQSVTLAGSPGPLPPRIPWEQAARESGLADPKKAPAPSLLLTAAPQGRDLDRQEQEFWTRLGRSGGWGAEIQLLDPKRLTGDLFSASPLLGVGLAAGLLSGRWNLAAFPGRRGLEGATPELRTPLAEVWVGAADPDGLAGLVSLRAAQKLT